MPDPRIINYLRQHQGKYPLDALKQALIKTGFTTREVEEGIRLVGGTGAGGPQTSPTPAEAQAAGGNPMSDPAIPTDVEAGAPADDGLIRYNPVFIYPNTLQMIRDAGDFFSRLDLKQGMGPAILHIALFSVISMALYTVLAFSGVQPLPGTRTSLIIGFVSAPVFSIILHFFGAAFYHVVCRILGGAASYSASFIALAAVWILFPINVLLGMVPFGWVPVFACSLYLSVQAAWGVHKIEKRKAWIAFGCLGGAAFACVLVLTLAAAFLMSKVQPLLMKTGVPLTSAPSSPEEMEEYARAQRQAHPENVPSGAPGLHYGAPGGQLGPGTSGGRLPPGVPRQIPADLAQDPQKAMLFAQKMMQDLRKNPQTSRQYDQAMSQMKGRNFGAMIQDIQSYARMKRPPKGTLALLDGPGRERLTEVWPNLSAPIRKAVVESVKRLPPEKRMETVEQIIQGNQDQQMNQLVNQGMQLLQTLQKQGFNPGDMADDAFMKGEPLERDE